MLACNVTTEEPIQIYFSRKLLRFLLRLANLLSFFFFFFFEISRTSCSPRISLNECFCAFLPFCSVFEKIQKNYLRKIAPLLSWFRISASVIAPFKYIALISSQKQWEIEFHPRSSGIEEQCDTESFSTLNEISNRNPKTHFHIPHFFVVFFN